MSVSFLDNVRVEVVPSRGILPQLLSELPPPANLSVTALPRHDISHVIDTAVALSSEGYAVTAHLPARAYSGADQLRIDLGRLIDGGVSDLLIVSGDASMSRAYPSSLELAQDVTMLSPGTFTIGVAGYPQGHPLNGSSLDSLKVKQPHADSLVTQMCFDPQAVVGYANRLNSEGVTLPVWLGTPGPVSRIRLIRLAAKVGVSTSLSLASKTQGMAQGLLSSSRFDPLPFISSVANHAPAAGARFHGVHLFSFNDFTAVRTLVDTLRSPHDAPAVSR